jgi:caffeoyl-CoA O-methyltransferase
MNQKILSKLSEMEKTWSVYRGVSRDEGILLNTIIQISNFKNILEIGTSSGYSGICMAEGVQHTGGHVKTIEIEPERVKLARQNFEEVGLSNYITVLEGDSTEILKTLNEKYDLIFIDGGDYSKAFEFANSNLLKVNGILAADNMIHPEHEHDDFKKAVENSGNYQSVIIDSGGGLLIALKIK